MGCRESAETDDVMLTDATVAASFENQSFTSVASPIGRVRMRIGFECRNEAASRTRIADRKG
jgi:hypothetical protein